MTSFSLTRRSGRSVLFTVSALAACAVPALFATTAVRAGGFGILVTQPTPTDIASDARLTDAFLVVQAAGCHGPGASLTVTAEGINNGKRVSLAQPLTRLDTTEVGIDRYAMRREWPAQGSWVLSVVANAKPVVIKGKTYKTQSRLIIDVKPDGSLETIPVSTTAPDGSSFMRQIVKTRHVPSDAAMKTAIASTLKKATTTTAQVPPAQ
jgi:hypothetical protein